MFTPSWPLAVPLAGAVTVRGPCGPDGEQEAVLTVAADGGSARLAASPDLGAFLSPGLRDVMRDELDACRQLLEFDPDSKCKPSGCRCQARGGLPWPLAASGCTETETEAPCAFLQGRC